MRIAMYGASGNVGSVLVPALQAKGWEVSPNDPTDADVAVDFTTPDAVIVNVRQCLELGVPLVIGTTGWDTAAIAAEAERRGVPVFFAPNYSIGAVVLERLSALAARWLPDAHIVEMHDASKRDAPSGTALATASAMGTDPPISSIRLPGLVAHQEVIFSAAGQILTIRHDSLDRSSFVDGVLLAVERVRSLPPGLTVGLDFLLD